ncbi:MAG: ABC transporter ATP-binding protein [Ectothiorhodospiraceae bacterium]|nr:ABC transporter ATP-binding protein [Ectothiorhodospiraceae bacterium]
MIAEPTVGRLASRTVRSWTADATTAPADAVLEVADLVLEIDTDRGPIRPVCGVSLTVPAGSTLGLVGESGCGKTLTCLAAADLLPSNVRAVRGEIRLLDMRRALDTGARCADDDRRRLAWRRRLAMVFQNPLAALNPVRTVGWQVMEAFRVRTGASRRAARIEALGLLERVGIPDPRSRMRAYPHELSGGMSQRVMIAMALAGNPRLLIADEATTALDVTVQAQIVDLMRELQAELDTAVLFVTHDLGLVAEVADTVAVMYAGTVVETGPTRVVFDRPAHPYTAGLLRCAPRLDRDVVRLDPIDGSVPAPTAERQGCAFAPRCPRASARCTTSAVSRQARGSAHVVACHHPMPT